VRLIVIIGFILPKPPLKVKKIAPQPNLKLGVHYIKKPENKVYFLKHEGTAIN
jgi:hypothetical protein